MKVSELVEKTCGKKIDCIQTGSECDFIGNLAYFYKKLCDGDDVVLDIEVNPNIMSDYVNRMIDLGVKVQGRVNTGYNAAMFRKNPAFVMNLIINTTPTDWFFDVNASTFANATIREAGGNGYVPLTAYFLISKMKDGSNGKLHLQTIHGVGSSTVTYYLQHVILMCYGNKLLKDLVLLENCTLGQAEWYAYVLMQQQYNRMNNTVSTEDKYNWLVEHDVKVGDIVLLYTIGDKKNTVIGNRELQSCKIAIVLSIDKTRIELDVLGSSELVLTQIERVSQDAFKERTYEDYTRFYRRNQDYDYKSVGVEYLTFDEDFMIMLPIPDDSSMQVMILPSDNGSWDIMHVELNTLETIYAVVENRKIRYNRDRFLQKYFPDTVPFYERFKAHQPTKYENITQEELLKKYGEGV